MQGGGFAGTIQAFVPGALAAKYHDAIEKVFGAGSCYLLRLREQEPCGSFEPSGHGQTKELHTPAEVGIVKLFHVTGKTAQIPRCCCFWRISSVKLETAEKVSS